METKKTALTYFKNLIVLFGSIKIDSSGKEFIQFNYELFYKVLSEAKQMEKEQIKDAFVKCWVSNIPDGIECKLDAEQYYNETYGN